MENKHTTGHLLAVLTILIWGTTFISTKILLNDFTPVEILFFRFILGFVALMIVYPHRLKVVNKKHESYLQLLVYAELRCIICWKISRSRIQWLPM